ncbi:MAG: hypothetical protein KGJ02_02805 [Verrucomicrobiota bacterium]|nr:hypothetical protein [Verrucomicrobiota bacterium]
MNSTSDLPEQTPQLETASTKPREVSPAFRAFEERLTQFATPEEKITEGLAFMRSSISQEGTPRFREFWDARKLVLPCFRENINPAIRSKLWGEYVELTVEARRLKEILEEQSAFAMEQIDLALAALETDLGNLETLVKEGADISFPEQSPTMKAKAETYNQVQRELNLLNTLASRLNGLRKEVIKTDMRIRFKTKFFKRFSELGDRIFPQRKQLIDQISQEFERDVEQFANRHFQGTEVVGAPYFALREEIKALQGMAKVFTLSSGVFNRTRLKLSECWDKLKEVEKEHKKEISAKKQVSQENRQGIEKKIEELGSRVEGMNLQDLDRSIDEIVQEMRKTELHHFDVKDLRNQLAKLREPFLAAQEARAKALEEAEREKLRIKRERVVQLKERVANTLREGPQMEVAPLEQQIEEIRAEIKQLEISKIDQQQLDRSMRQLKHLLAERKEHSLIHLSEDDRTALENLRQVLVQKKERRQEIKEQLEHYRRALGGSNLDFEKAMLYRELMDQEKERLEKTNDSIEELEQKISELEG